MEKLRRRHGADGGEMTPLSFLDRAASVYPDYTSVVYGDSIAFTWAETRRRCLRLASALRSRGVAQLDVVSVLAPNLPAMYEIQFGVPMSGAVLNSLNTRLDAATLAVVLRHSSTKLIFVAASFLPTLHLALSLFPPGHPPPPIIRIDDNGDNQMGSKEVSYEELISTGDPEFEWVRPESEWDPMVINYTSGTTAAPKGAVHSHRGMFVMAMANIANWPLPKRPVYLWTLPMFHGNGWSFVWSLAAVGGINICIRRVDPAEVLDAIARYQVTHMCAAPTVLTMLADAAAGPMTLSSPVHLFTGGAPPTKEIILRAEKLGFVVYHGYGLTECGGTVLWCEKKSERDKLSDEERAVFEARQGVQTLAMTDVAVLDVATGRRVPHDGSTMGEIAVRSPSVMLGYLENEEETRKVIRDDGWLMTGDVAVVHPDDGFIEVKDRSKDVIISGGENISSVELEAVLMQHPSVREVAVVARPDMFWGEMPCAFVVVEGREGVLSERELVGWCRQRMPHFMAPRTVMVLRELPRTVTGKVRKVLLREEAKKMGPTNFYPNKNKM